MAYMRLPSAGRGICRSNARTASASSNLTLHGFNPAGAEIVRGFQVSGLSRKGRSSALPAAQFQHAGLPGSVLVWCRVEHWSAAA